MSGNEAHDRRPMRVARALSVLGFCSRREGDRLIAAGRVAINREVVSSPGATVDLSLDQLSVDDKPINQRAAPTYIVLHKPAGVVSTVRDRHAPATVVDLVPSSGRLYPVGRLDKDSEGLILLTNDGDFAQAVAHPRNRTEKEYLVQLTSPISGEQLQRLRSGIVLDERPVIPVALGLYRGPIPWGPASARGGGTWLRIVLQEGRNREIRRMLEVVGHRAARLIRTRIGSLRLGRLQPRQWRNLSPSEVASLTESRPRRGSKLPGGVASDTSPVAGAEATAPLADARPRRTDRERAPIVIAIDGPSAAGKTVVGSEVARLLGATFLDTGVLYRAVALLAGEQGISPDDGRALARLATELDLRVREKRTSGTVERTFWLGDRDVTLALRFPEVDARVSAVAVHPEVRTALIPAQRRAAGAGAAVVVGRDVGTVVFPDAPLKVYLDASAGERARRRAAQQGPGAQLLEVETAMARRDAADSGRPVAPLMVASDAVVIDTEGVDVSVVVARVRTLARRRLRRHG